MNYNICLTWDEAPAKGRFEVSNGSFVGGSVAIGTGGLSGDTFHFTERGQCRITLAIEAHNDQAALSVTDTEQPFSFRVVDAVRSGSLVVPGMGVTAVAQEDVWAGAGGSASASPESSPAMAPLPVYPGFSEEQLKQFGPVRERDVFETVRHVYTSPFMYGNLDVGNFYEIDPTKGIEFKANDGFITITEDKPIVGVSVVGSGCVPRGYNIVEWWDEGETIDNMKNQLVKRQRVDNLNGTHPSIWVQVLMGTFPGLTYNEVAPGQMRNAVDCLKKLSQGFYEGFYVGFYENTANFRIGPPYPTKVTVRCGCLATEDEGTTWERYPGDYAIRVVEVTVIK